MSYSPHARPTSVGIIGATGFVGRSLVHQITQEGLGQVRLFGRSRGSIAGHSVEPFPDSTASLRGLDVVVHLAGIAHQIASSAGYEAVNVQLPLTTAKLAHAAGVRRFVFVSSTHVHGRWSQTPMSPESPFSPVSPYAVSKASAEQQLQTFATESELELAVVRPPLVYGPGAKANFALLAKFARAGILLPLGCARAKRSMVSIENLRDAILTMASMTLPRSPAVLLPADDRDLSVSEMFSLMTQAAGRTSLQLSVPEPVMKFLLEALGKQEMFESLFRPAVINRSHWKNFGWSPPQTVGDGLANGVRPAGVSRQ